MNDEFQSYKNIHSHRPAENAGTKRKKRRKRINSQARNELGQSREKVANEGDNIAPPSSDNTLSLLRTAILYRTLYPPRGYKR